MKNIKRIISATSLLLVVCVMIAVSSTKAASLCIIKIPVSAQLYYNGLLFEDDKAASITVSEGRIHQIAASLTGVLNGSKQFLIPEEWNSDYVTVYDNQGKEITPGMITVGAVDYTVPDATELELIGKRVSECAIAFHNRVGYGSGNIGNYFLSGSDAYNKAIGSDEGRKWGKPINPPGIATVEFKEYYKYTNDVFAAKVHIASQPINGYVEEYDVYFVFMKNNGKYYVTNFTYQP